MNLTAKIRGIAAAGSAAVVALLSGCSTTTDGYGRYDVGTRFDTTPEPRITGPRFIKPDPAEFFEAWHDPLYGEASRGNNCYVSMQIESARDLQQAGQMDRVKFALKVDEVAKNLPAEIRAQFSATAATKEGPLVTAFISECNSGKNLRLEKHRRLGPVADFTQALNQPHAFNITGLTCSGNVVTVPAAQIPAAALPHFIVGGPNGTRVPSLGKTFTVAPESAVARAPITRNGHASFSSMYCTLQKYNFNNNLQ